MNIVFLSNHWYRSPRRAGFHHLADAMHALGHTVTFATVGLSRISYARRDFRTHYEGLKKAHNTMEEIRPGFFSYVHFTLWHPHTLLLPGLDRLLSSFMDRYESFSLGALKQHVEHADMVVYESCSALFLFRLCKKLAPHAKHVYRVSDDIRILRSTPQRMVSLEKEITPEFDLISVPCRYLHDKFAPLPQVQLHFHGITKESFDTATKSPYTEEQNCIFVGTSHLDQCFLRHAAEGARDVHFHVIGNFPKTVAMPNVHYYGEMPFLRTVPYIKFAQAGMQIRLKDTATSSLTDSLKVLQYRYCGLPIIAPQYLNLSREGVFYYDSKTPESCTKAVHAALVHGVTPHYKEEVSDWQQVAAMLLATL